MGHSANCDTTSGSVAIYVYKSNSWRLSSMLSTDSAEYGVSGVCTFGRTLLVIDDTALLVGVPDARGGAGTVLVYDITHPLNPQKLCEWGGSKYQWRYGQSLARGGPLRSGLVLIAVGSLGSPSVVVRQLAVDATRGKPECIGHAAIDGIIIPKVHYPPPLAPSPFPTPPPALPPPSIPPQPSLPPDVPPSPYLPPAHPSPPSFPPPPSRPPGICEDRCEFDSDGVCDDGGAGSITGVCVFGFDCTDCGTRDNFPPEPPAISPRAPPLPPGPSSPPPSPNTPRPPTLPGQTPLLPPPLLPPSPRAPYTATVALNTVSERVHFAHGHAILVTTATGALSFTAFCDRDSVRALSEFSSPLPVSCRQCPPGYHSTGGVSHECTLCDNLLCATEGQTVFSTDFVGSARNGTLKTGDRVLVSMTAYNKVQDGLPQGQQSSQQLVLDLSPPFGGTVRVRSRSAMMAYRCC